MLVTVIIPTHNRADLLVEAIESVAQQSYKNVEIIVIDDIGSSETKKALEPFSALDVRYLVNPGRGAASSRNLGAAKASGELVAFLDDDDLWLPMKLEKQVTRFQEAPSLSAVFSACEVRFEELGISYNTRPQLRPTLSDVCVENCLGATISCVMRRDVFEGLGGFDERFPAREEYDLWLRLLASGAQVSVIGESLCVSRASFTRGDRISSSLGNYKRAIDLLNEKHSELIDRVLTKKEKRIRKARQSAFVGAQASKIGAANYARVCFAKAFFRAPGYRSATAALLSLFPPRIQVRMRARFG